MVRITDSGLRSKDTITGEKQSLTLAEMTEFKMEGPQ